MQRPKQVNLVEHPDMLSGSDSEGESGDSPPEEVNLTEFRSNPKWLFDSSTTSHVTGSKSSLDTLVLSSSSASIFIVDGAQLPIVGKGSVLLEKNKSNSYILYVPGIRKDLLFVSTITDTGHFVLFTSQSCLVLDETNPRRVVLSGPREFANRLYRFKPYHKDKLPTAFDSLPPLDQTQDMLSIEAAPSILPELPPRDFSFAQSTPM